MVKFSEVQKFKSPDENFHMVSTERNKDVKYVLPSCFLRHPALNTIMFQFCYKLPKNHIKTLDFDAQF